MSNTIRKILLLMTCSTALFVCACGQRGDLYIDKSDSQKINATVKVKKPVNETEQADQAVQPILDNQEEGS